MNINEISVEDNFIIIISNNASNKIEKLKKDVQSNFIQFHFVLAGKIDFYLIKVLTNYLYLPIDI